MTLAGIFRHDWASHQTCREVETILTQVFNPLEGNKKIILHNDIIFSQGTFWPQDVHKEWGFVLCCGLYYIRSNERTKKLLSKVKNELEIERDDQVSFNKTLLKENVVWDINTYYYLEHKNIKFLCSNQPITGNAGDVSILVLPHAKFPRVNDTSDLVYVKHILSDKNSVSVIDTLKNNDCYFI